ncbi:MAG: DUF5661 family protein [Weeksellaceae bacterium]
MTLIKLATHTPDKIKGGLADNKSPKSFSPHQLKEGIKVEMEHTNSKTTAQEIAMDHLTEIPDYYSRLKKMEAAAKKPKPK